MWKMNVASKLITLIATPLKEEPNTYRIQRAAISPVKRNVNRTEYKLYSIIKAMRRFREVQVTGAS